MSIPTSSALIVMRDRLIDECERLKAELECARGDLKTAMEIIERYKKDAERYQWLMTRGLHTKIHGATASISPGRGPYICVELPSCGAPNVVALGSGADAYVDAAIEKERT